MIVLTTSRALTDAKIYVLKANYKASRIDVFAKAGVGDFQNTNEFNEHRITETLPAKVSALLATFSTWHASVFYTFSSTIRKRTRAKRVEKLKTTQKFWRRIGTTACFRSS